MTALLKYNFDTIVYPVFKVMLNLSKTGENRALLKTVYESLRV